MGKYPLLKPCVCSLCKATVPYNSWLYFIKAEGNCNDPEMLACHDCMKKAPADSKVGQIRDKLWSDEFKEPA